MRFSSLSLHKYGHFEDCTLDFPAAETDFHLVFGTNEAGKSTTLAAVSDLLFGFPHIKAYHFRFDASLQRVGATLEAAGTRLAVRRRRGTTNTLLDEAGVPVAESRLQAMLHNRPADEFRTRFSLDHARLRDGGRTIVDAGGDLGQTLFAAGSGVLGAQALLKTLQGEAELAWRARGKSTYQVAAAERSEADRRVKATAIKPRDWKMARELLGTLVNAQDSLLAERADLQAALNTISRRRALAVPVQQRAASLGVLASLSTPAFDAGQEATHDEVTRAIAGAEVRLLAATAAIDEAARARDAIVLDATVLESGERIDALVKEAAEVSKARHDLAGIEADLRDLLDEAARSAVMLDLPALSPGNLLERLPAPAILADLQVQATRRQSLDTRLDQVREQRRVSVDALKRTNAALGRHGPEAPGGLPEHHAATPDTAAVYALRHGRTCAAVAGRLAERRRDSQKADAASRIAMLKLLPWRGTADALAAIVPPPEEDIRTAEKAQTEAMQTSRQGAQALQAGRDALARLELEASEVASSRRAVSAGELGSSRADRAQAWSPLRAHLSGQAPVADIAGAVTTYEAAVSAADRLADERYETAAASARLAELDVQIALARLTEAQQETGQRTALETTGHLASEWAARLAAGSLPPMTPAAARTWSRSQGEALEKAGLLTAALAVEADDIALVGGARAGLMAVLDAATAKQAAGAPFDTALEMVQRLVTACEDDARAKSAVAGAAKAEADTLATCERNITALEGDIAAWTTGWHDASSAAGVAMPPGSVAILLPLYERLRSVLLEAGRTQSRIAGIARDQARFAARALSLAADCRTVEPTLDAQAVAEALRLRLQAARGDERAACELDRTLERKASEHRDADHDIKAGEQRLAPLMAMAGAADRAGLAAAIQASSQRRNLVAEINRLEHAILTVGDGLALDVLVGEAAASDPAWLAQETTRLQTAITALDAGVNAKAEAVGEARHAFDALNGDGDAALAATEEAQAQAAMADAAEEYLLKRAQAVMLQWAVNDYRKRQESPLLTRAGALFNRLTLGRYTALDIDRSQKAPRLVANCADGRSVITVDAMSEGTADQLFLALRLAALEQSLDAGVTLPFLADDLFINFDDGRARAGFQVLAEIARRTQVLFFTHHEHLRAVAQGALSPHVVSACELA